MKIETNTTISAPKPASIPVRLGVLVTLCLLVAVTHGRNLRGEFVLDDTGAIRDNVSIRSLGTSADVFGGGHFTTVAGRPLFNFSLAMNYACGKLDPFGYHLINIVVHISTAFVLFCLLRRIFETSATTVSRASPLALAASLLWSVHPLTVNAVSYVVQRAESIASLFCLLGLWGFVKGVQTSQRRWWVISVLAGWLGGLTKETIATLPLQLIVLDLLVVTRDWNLALRRHWRMYLASLSCWIPLGICMVLSQNRERTVGYGRGISVADHLQTQVWAVARYLKLIVWPDPLIFDYGHSFLVTDLAQVIPAAAVLGLFLALTSWLLLRHSPLAAAGVLMTLALAPSSAVPIITQTVAEHRMYLASAYGIAGLVAVLFGGLERRSAEVSVRCGQRQLAIVGGCVVLLLLVLGLRTADRTDVLRTRLSIWCDTATKQPTNQRALVGAAHAIGIKTGNLNEAVAWCDRAVALRGGVFTRHALETRGGFLARLGQYEQAVADFSEALALEPNLIDNLYERANAYRDLGRFEECLNDLDEASRIDSRNLMTESLRGSVFAAKGELDRALDCFDRVLANDAQHVDARRRRAAVYAKLNRWDDASQEVRQLMSEGLRIDPQFVEEVERHHLRR